MFWKTRQHQISLKAPLLMGILNITPDSFSDGGNYMKPEAAVDQAIAMLAAGAVILDLGAESSRPGSLPVPFETEVHRLLPVLKAVNALKQKYIFDISIDTTKPAIARRCLQEGADIINDVSGLLEGRRAMAEVVADFDAGIILMHRRGSALTMHTKTSYSNVVEEVTKELQERMGEAIDWGIRPEQVVIDPGIGFAKNTSQNLQILDGLDRLASLNRPILLGYSRKSFLGELTGSAVSEREFATAAVTAFAVFKGAHILRIHNVQAARDVVSVIQSLLKKGEHTHVRTF